jgi:protein-arginine kinase activator protein McsA
VSEPLDAWTSVATHLYCPRCQTLPATGAVFAIHGESGAQVSLCEHCTTQRERGSRDGMGPFRGCRHSQNIATPMKEHTWTST